MRAHRWFQAGIALFLAASPAAAQAPVRDQPIEEVAADLAYGFCPLFLAGQFSLTGPELAERGFAPKVETSAHPRFGEMKVVTAKRADGEIAFGGASGKACTVVVRGSRRSAVAAKLRSNMAFMGLGFKAAPSPGPAAPPGTTVETFKAPVEKQFLYVQLLQIGGPSGSGPVAAMLFVTDK